VYRIQSLPVHVSLSTASPDSCSPGLRLNLTNDSLSARTASEGYSCGREAGDGSAPTLTKERSLRRKSKIVASYARMWPREIFDLMDSKKGQALASVKNLLNHPGVYILYCDDQPYYIGRANHLFNRLRRHAMSPRARIFNFWNHFSAYVVPDKRRLDEVEGILITATPTANRSHPRLTRLSLPPAAWKPLRKARQAMFAG